MKRVPICEALNADQYNNGNLHDYDPYMITDDGNVIDTDWYQSLSDNVKNRIRMPFDLKKVTIPHDVQVDNDDRFLATIHQAYLDSFDYHVWFDNHLPMLSTNVSMIRITSLVKDTLLQMYTNRNNQCNHHMDKFKKQIEDVLKSNAGGWFMRLSSTSGKNEDALEPLYTVDDVISRLVRIKLFVDKEYRRKKESYLILIPWHDDIEFDPQYEWRVFVVNGKITAACPQRWFDIYQYSDDELDMIEQALLTMPIDQFIYKTFIADVFIKNNTCYVIELNPFGAHCGAGSALFNWVTDYDVLYG